MNKNVKFFIIWLTVSILYTILVIYFDRNVVGPGEVSVGFSTINEILRRMLPYNSTLYFISSLIGNISFGVVAVFAGIGLVQLIKRKSLYKVDIEILGLGTIFIIILIMYIIFKYVPINYRPVLIPGEDMEFSFPSSHTLMAVTVFGSAALLMRRKKGQVYRVLTILAYIMMCLIIATRLLSGTHWVTDIIGGTLYGVTLLSFYKNVIVDRIR